MAIAVISIVIVAALVVVASGVWVAIGLIESLTSPKRKLPERGNST